MNHLAGPLYLLAVACIIVAIKWPTTTHSPITIPFDPRLCENTGIMQRYYVTQEAKVVYMLSPILDCSKLNDINNGARYHVKDTNQDP